MSRFNWLPSRHWKRPQRQAFRKRRNQASDLPTWVEILEERTLLSLDNLAPLFVPDAVSAITAPSAGRDANVRAFAGSQQTTVAGAEQEILPYGSQFSGGVNVASGDVNRDGVPDIITGAGPGGGPHVRVFSGADGGNLLSFFAYNSLFTGGVNVASGDVNGDGFADIITGAGPGGGPHVQVFSGADGSVLASFFAYGDAFTGGVNVASGDVNRDGFADIITGAGAGGGPHIRVFSGKDGAELASFFAYGAAFSGGVNVAAGDVNGDGATDIITGAGPNGGPHVRVFNGTDGSELSSFFAYGSDFSGGVHVAAGDVNGDGVIDVITGAGPGGGPDVAVFNDGSKLFSFYAYDSDYRGGVSVAAPIRNPQLKDDGFLAPGQPEEPVAARLNVKGSTSFANALGIYPVDDAEGRIGGLLPGDVGYAQAAVQAAVFQQQFASGVIDLSSFDLELLGNQRYGLFLIQNSTVAAFLANNPRNDRRNSPLAFFSFNAASSDGYDHLIFQQDSLAAGWEDLAGGGDHDFDDLELEILFDSTPPAISVMLSGDFDTEPLGDNSTIFESVTLTGQTEPNLPVTIPALGLMTQADENGNFFFENVPLAIGQNMVTVETTDDAGNKGQTALTVTRECGFFDDLRGSTVTILGGTMGNAGSIAVENMQAVLREGDSFSVALEKTFVVPNIPSQLNLEFANLNFDTSDAGFINDAFELALLDENGQTLVQPIAIGRDAYFNITEGIAAESATGVTINGNTISLDLSGLFAGTTATLVARLVNNDSDTGTSVAIACINIEQTGNQFSTPVTVPQFSSSGPTGSTTSTTVTPTTGTIENITPPPGAVQGLPAGTTTVPTTWGNTGDALDLLGQTSSLNPPAAGLQDAAPFDTRGTEFWIGFMDNLYESGNVPQKALFITGDIATTGSVDIPGLIDPMTNQPFHVDFAVNLGQITTVELPSNDPNDTNDDNTDFDVEAELIAQIEQRGVHVVTQDPVTVYGINRAVNTTDAFLAIPVDALGTEYINLGYENGFRLISSTPNTEFLVVATEDNTVVNIVPGDYTFPTTAAFADIFRPSGTTTSDLRDLSFNGNDIGPTLLDESGTHTLTVRPPFDGYAGTYSFELLDAATAATPINIGDTITTNIANGRTAQLFAIDATRGQRLYFDAINPSPAPNVTLQFITPSGSHTTLDRQTDTHGLLNLINNPLQIKETGRHYVLITGNQDTPFDFSFRFQDLDTAPTLPFDTDIDETLNPGEARIFQFQGTVGQDLLLDSFTSSGLSLLQLYGPGGELFGQYSSNADSTPLHLIDSGTYHLIIGAGNIDAPNPIAFRLFDVANTAALPLGTAITQGFAGGKSTLFRVTSTGTQMLNFDVTAGSGRVQIDVYDPAGNRITTNGASDFSVPLLSAGDYLVVVRGVAVGDAGDVTFQATVTSDAPVAKSGFNTTQTLTVTAGQVAEYQFSGPAGTPFLVDSLDVLNENLNIELFDPNGNRILTGIFPANEQQDIPNIDPPRFLPLSGTYTIRVSGQTATDAGDYTFRVLDLETFATPLAFDTIQSGTLPTGRDFLVYSFNATAGELYNFNALSGAGFSVRVRDSQLAFVYPQGVFDASATQDGPFRITRTGIHYVMLRGNQDTPANFEFQIQDLNAIPTINLGDEFSGTISPGRSQDHYFVYLTAGQRIFIDSLDDDTEVGTLRIRRPGEDTTFHSGASNQNGDSASFLLLTVPETGQYLITLEGASDADTDYRFRILDLDAAPLLTFDTDLNVTLDPARQAAFFRIDANAAETLNFDNITSNGTFNWQLYDPSGRTQVGQNSGLDFTGRTLVDGTYYLGIFGTSNTPRDLTFHVTRTADPMVTMTGFNTEVTLNVPINGQADYSFDAPAGRLIFLNVINSDFGIPEQTVTLNAGDTYLVRDLRGATFGFDPDLTGSVITSDKPIAVFGGNRATFVPTNFFAADHLVEQMTPTNTWGRRFVTYPLATGTTVGDRFRFLAQADGTDIFINGTLAATLNRGEFYEQILIDPSEITSSQPILVAQYAHSQDFYRGQPGGDPAFLGDPFMILVPPYEQFLSNYTVTTPAEDAIPVGERFDRNYINIVAPADAVGRIELDGVPIDSGEFSPIGSSGFFGAQVAVALGSYELAGPLPFGVFVYGFGSFDSYGYTGGQSLSSVANVTSVNLTPDTLTTRLNIEQEFTATVTDENNNPVEGVRVDFAVSGVNPQTGFAFTDAQGLATFRYTGMVEGRDVVTASVGQILDDSIVDWLGEVQPPTITIDSPLDGSTLPAGTTLVASGLAFADTPFAALDAVLVNGTAVEQLDGAGHFFSTLFIGPGENVFEFIAFDSLGKFAVARLTITGSQTPVGQVDFTQFSDVTGSFQPEYVRTSYNSDTSTLFAEIAIRNAGQFPADVPLLVGIANISDPRVLVRDPDGVTPDGIPYYDFTGLTNTNSLLPGDQTGVLSATFYNPNQDQFDYDLVFFGKINQAPVITSLPTFEANVDREYQYDVNANDPDGDPVQFSLTLAPQGMTIDESTGLITWTPQASDRGSQTVTIQANDGRGGVTEQTFVLHAIDPPSNRAPVMTSVPLTTANVGTEYQYDADAIDADGDTLMYQLLTAPTGMMIDPNTGLVTWMPAADQLMDQTVTIEVSDGNGGAAQQTFTICVFDAIDNHAPILFSDPPNATPPGVFSTQAQAIDPDGDSFTFSLAQAPSGMQIDSLTGVITWDPAVVGDHPLTVRVTDELGAFSEQSFTLSVLANNPPTFTSTALTTATVGQSYQYDVEADDLDSDTLQFRLLDSPSGMAIDSTSGLITWLTDAQAFETERVVVEVSDGKGGTATQSFEISVTGGQSLAQNRSPFFTSQPPATIVAGETLIYRSSARDPNQDPLTFDLPLGPAGMTVDPTTGTLVWQPSANQVGRHAVVLRVQDGRGGIQVQSFEISVTPANTAPVITSLPTLDATVGSPFAYRVFAQDADGDPLNFTLINPPAGATLTPLTGTSAGLLLTPASPGMSTVTIQVEDGRGGIDEQTFDLTVSASNGNLFPTIDSAPRTSIAIDRTWVYQFAASDLDGDPLSINLSTFPAGMQFDPQTRIATWTPTENQLGPNPATLTVDDGLGGTLDQSFTIDVVSFESNTPPDIISRPPTSAIVGEEFAYDLRAFDADGDPVEWRLVDGPAGVSLDGSRGTLRWTPTLGQLGLTTITVQASDPFSAQAIQTITVLVNCTNLPPRILSTAPSEAVADERLVYPVRAIDPEGGSLSFALMNPPTGMTIDSANGIIRWTPTLAQLGPATATVEVADNAGNTALQTFTLNVGQVVRNLDPVITSRPGFRAVLDELYTYQVEATDPEGEAVSFTLLTAPAGMMIDTNGLIQWMPTSTPDQSGPHIVEVAVTDPQGGQSVQRYAILARANQTPEITSTPVTTISAGAMYHYDVQVTDPENDPLTYSLNIAPAGMTIDQLGRILWNTSAMDSGSQTVEILVTDAHGATGTQTFTLDVTPDMVAPRVEILVSANPAAVNTDVVITVRATDDVGVDSITLTRDGQEIHLDQNGTATLTTMVAGIFHLTATATDESGNTGTDQFDLRVFDPNDTQGPIITIQSPQPNAILTTFTDITGTITDDNLDFYRVEFARADLVDLNDPLVDDPDYKLLAEGFSTVVTADVLATFDPTMLMNDSFVIRVFAQDLSGNTSAQMLSISLDGQLKLGQFNLDFTDLSIPLTGIPITITRSYDTRQADEVGDFGFGWNLTLQDARIRESLPVNPLEEQGVFFAATPFREGTRIFLTNPEGRRIGFTFTADPQFSLFGGGSFTPQFIPDPGVTDTLDVGLPFLRKINGAYHDAFSGAPFNPSAYRLTTKDGTVYEYGQFSGLQNVIDPNGNRLEFREDGVYSSTGESIQFIRDVQGRITQIIDPAGNPLTYQYDASGDLISFTDQVGLKTRYTYLSDPAHFLDTITDPRGIKILDAAFDANGRLIGTTDALGASSSQDYDFDNSLFSTTDANGNTTQFRYDSLGNITEQIDALGHSKFYEYADPQNPYLETRVVDENGNETLFSFDARGNVLTMMDPLGGMTTFAYNSTNDLMETSNALSLTERFVYDEHGNLISAIDTNGNAEKFTHDEFGRTLTQTDQNGNTTSFEYLGGADRPSKITFSDGAVKQFVYDSFGNITFIVDENGNVSQAQFDAKGRLTRVLGPSGEENIYIYDGDLLVELRKRVDANTFKSTQFQYNDAGRLKRRIEAGGGITEFSQDANGNAVFVEDPSGNQTTYQYDEINRLVEEIDSFGNSIRYEYDAIGNQTATVDREGQRIEFQFDELGRVTQEEWLKNGVSTYIATFDYDVVGNLLTANDPFSKLTFTYDNIGHVISTDNFGTANQPRLILDYQYDPAGNLTLVRDNTGVEVVSEYNNRDRLTALEWDGLSVDAVRVEFDYDLMGNQSEIRRFNNLLGTERISRSNMSHDASGRIIDVEHRNALDDVFVEYDYTYDLINRITRESHHGDTTDYTYDLDGQLLTANRTVRPDEYYEYDATGNRTNSYRHANGYEIGVGNRLVSDGEFRFEYNLNGSLIRKTEIATGNVISYEYDVRGRLIRQTESTSGGVIINEVVNIYDVFDRRISQETNGLLTLFSYDRDNNWADLDSNGVVQARYLYGAEIDDILARQRQGEQVDWYLKDQLKTVGDLINHDGDLINHVEYDSFGVVLSETNQAVGDRFAFTGREFDPVSETYLYRNRYYDANVGRFLSADPLGFGGGDTNLYRYAFNSPRQFTDPFGLTIPESKSTRTFSSQVTTTTTQGPTSPGGIFRQCLGNLLKSRGSQAEAIAIGTAAVIQLTAGAPTVAPTVTNTPVPNVPTVIDLLGEKAGLCGAKYKVKIVGRPPFTGPPPPPGFGKLTGFRLPPSSPPLGCRLKKLIDFSR